ncbi:dihydroorotate dehydrogenase [bacterium]|nr:dihydroorotate dehydrogenase [bacterium]
MRSPVMLASGTVGYGPEYEGVIDFEATGAIVTKTITLEPRAGNAPPRLIETPGGLLNAIGLENVGLERFLAEKLPEAAQLPLPIVVSVAGIEPAQFGQLAAAVGERDEVAAIELNISCPNVERPRNPVWSDPVAVGEIVSAARGATDKTLSLKLSPNTSDILSVAEAAERAGVDALTVANTLPGMRIDIELRRPALGNVTGGLSGAALMPVNLALVWTVAGHVSVPVIGSGGLADAGDALEFLAAGAVAVQVGTALFAEPAAPSRIAEGLRTYMKENDFASMDELVGMAREERRACAETA